jgi:hypothetical protein
VTSEEGIRVLAALRPLEAGGAKRHAITISPGIAVVAVLATVGAVFGLRLALPRPGEDGVSTVDG